MNNIPDVTLSSEILMSDFGFSVSDAGDVNGDMYDDVIIGAPSEIDNTGRVYIYYGGMIMNNIEDVIMTGEYPDDLFGFSVSAAGNVNGDGYTDVIISAIDYNSHHGKVYLYHGGNNMNNTSDLTFTGDNALFYYGTTVSDAGDVNGDGYSDIILGTGDFTYNTHPESYIFFGGNIMNNVADVIFTDRGGNFYAPFVSNAGDVNGDGFSDVIFSMPYLQNAFLYFGGITMDNVTDITIATSGYRVSISGAGDLNNDGYDDIIIGDPNFDSYRGRSLIYLSSPPDNRKNLFLFGAIQGMYDPVLDTEVPDTIKVYLRNSTSPFARVDSSKNILLGPGTGQNFLFRNAQNGIPYYIEVTHRNALDTWSATPVSFVNSDASIAFSVDEIYAYGNNEIQVDNNPYNVFAFYSGDVNQDGYIDLTDITLVFNDASNFISGYVVTDLTDDNIVDLTDLTMVFNNSSGFVSVVKP